MLHCVNKFLPKPSSHRVDVFYIVMDGCATLPSEQLSTLSQEESQYLSRLQRVMDQKSYAMAHCLLRQVLQHYTGIGAAELSFAVSESGKPRLDSPLGNVCVEFNLTHCPSLVACAVSASPVGIDTESYERRLEAEVEEYILHPDELLLVRAHDRQMRNRLTLDHWTCKEAAVKALGIGLQVDPKQIVIKNMGSAQASTYIADANYGLKQEVRLFPNLLPHLGHSLTVASLDLDCREIELFDGATMLGPY